MATRLDNFAVRKRYLHFAQKPAKHGGLRLFIPAGATFARPDRIKGHESCNCSSDPLPAKLHADLG